MTQFIVLKAELWPSMTLVFVNSIYKELYIVHETSGKITLLSFLIRFMLNFFLFIPLFSDLTIPSGSWYILRYTVNNKSRILLEVCSLCVACVFSCYHLLLTTCQRRQNKFPILSLLDFCIAYLMLPHSSYSS